MPSSPVQARRSVRPAIAGSASDATRVSTTTIRPGHVAGVVTCLFLVVGCSTVDDRRPFDAKIPAAWQAPLPHRGRTGDLVSWWSTFADPSLDALIAAAQAENPDVETAAAEIEAARALLSSARAGLAPGLTGSAALTRSGTGGDRANQSAAATTTSGGLDAAWEIDLFGKARRKTDAARLRVDGRVADWHGARVSLAAEVADYYVQYRACRQLEKAHAADFASQRQTVQAIETAESSGLRSSGDLALARASAASAAATSTAQRIECDLLVKSLARVTGGDEPRVLRLLKTGRSGMPKPGGLAPTGVPAETLRQRPDVAAAEQEIAATHAEIGAAEADLYPSLTLAGSVAISGSAVAGTTAPWSFGPTLSVPLFDGGSRRAAVAGAVAAHAAAVAAYRTRVLAAVAEVEAILVRIDGARRRIGDADVAARNYRAYFETVDANWKAGGASLLDREEARRSSRQAEVLLVEIRRDRVRQWIALYKALGGGWVVNTTTSGGRGP